MLELRTLGTLDLRAPGGIAAGALLAQPRSTALLIYLLLARPRGYIHRDILCALFWPDADESHARGALSQALTRIRRSAGRGVIQLRGKNEILVAASAVACDVLDFEAALAARDYARALELYAGPFLSGFYAPNMPGFERWSETERDRLRALAAGAAHAHAREHLTAGRLEDAARVAELALALAPESEAVAGEVVGALAAAGDRLGALRLYDSWAALLARDLELEPSEELQALAQALRESAALTPAEGDVLPRVPAVPHADHAAAEPPDEPGPAVSVPEAPAVAAGHEARTSPAAPWWRRRSMTTAAAAGVALLLGTWGLLQAGFLGGGFPVDASGRAAQGLTRQDWLVAADFDTPPADPGLALAFQTLLIRDLESAGYASAVGGIGALSRRGLEEVLARMRLPDGTRVSADLACDMAEREGAAGVLAGRVLPLGDEYVLDASILAVPGCNQVIRANTVASFEDLSRAVTAVSRELRSRLGESRASIRSSPPLPPITTEYIQALRAVSRYVADPTLWADEARGAAELLEAIRIDPECAFAHFLLALHYQRLGRFEQAVPHVVRAYQLRSQLPRPGRMGMEAIYQRYLASDPGGAMATVETIAAQFPAVDDATLPFIADAALWLGDWQRALEVSLSYLARGPAGLGANLAYARGAAAAWALGRVQLADSLTRAGQRAQAAAGVPPDRTQVLLHLLRHGDWERAEAYCDEQPGWDRCGYVYLATGRLSAAERVLRSGLASDASGRHPWNRAAATAALVYLEQARGRPDNGWMVLQSADRSMPMAGLARAGTHMKRFLICAAAAQLKRSAELPECRIEREDPAAWDADPSFTVVLRSGAWSRRLLAVRSLERGDPATALAQARAAVYSNFGNPGTIDNLIQALAFDALSQRDSAFARYITATHIERDCCFPTTAGIGMPLAPIYRRIGELAEDAGDVPTALHYYRAFLALWAKADPELQPQVQAVQARVARLLGGS